MECTLVKLTTQIFEQSFLFIASAHSRNFFLFMANRELKAIIDLFNIQNYSRIHALTQYTIFTILRTILSSSQLHNNSHFKINFIGTISLLVCGLYTTTSIAAKEFKGFLREACFSFLKRKSLKNLYFENRPNLRVLAPANPTCTTNDFHLEFG